MRRPKMHDVIARAYGRDGVLAWVNLLPASLFPPLGLRVGLKSKDRLAARMEDDAAAMRRKGYPVKSIETFSLPGVSRPDPGAHWYRVTYEHSAPRGDAEPSEPPRG